MPFKNWLAICEIPNQHMRAWIASEDDPIRLSKAQTGFPELFTENEEEGKVGPYPISHLRALTKLYEQKEEHENFCDRDADEDGPCMDCRYYANLPEFPVPYLCFRLDTAEVPTEISAQINVILEGTSREKTMLLTYFPKRLIDIQYNGITYFLGEINIFDVIIYMKDPVFIDE